MAKKTDTPKTTAQELDRRSAELDKITKNLAELERDLGAEKQALDEREAALNEREKAIAAREAELASIVVEAAGGTVQGDPIFSEEDVEVIERACDALGIPSMYVFSANIDRATGEVVVITTGGKRVRWLPGAKVELSEIEITGINPKKRKPIAGKALETEKE